MLKKREKGQYLNPNKKKNKNYNNNKIITIN